MRTTAAKITLLRSESELWDEIVRPAVRAPHPPRRKVTISSLALLVIAALLIGAYAYYRSQQAATVKRLVNPLLSRDLAVDSSLPELFSPAENRITHMVRAKEDFGDLLRKHGLDVGLAVPAQQALESLRAKDDKAGTLNPGEKVSLVFDPQGEISAIRLFVSPGKEVKLSRQLDRFGPEIISDTPPALERVAIGIVQTSFAAAAVKAGVSYDVVDDLVDIFSDRIEFNKDFRVGDRFTVIYRNVAKPKGKTGAEILAAAITTGGETSIAIRHVGSDGKIRYFDDKGKPLGSSFLRYPVQFSRITSYVTDSRYHPVLHRRRAHNGVDFAAPTGTPVRAVADGRVIFSGNKGPNGLMVHLRHGDRYTTAYLHLSRIAAGVTRGSAVSKGQVIGAVGSTGLSTGPHLHFSLFDKGKYVNPLSFKLSFQEELRGGNAINKKYLTRVLFTLEHYQSMELASR